MFVSPRCTASGNNNRWIVSYLCTQDWFTPGRFILKFNFGKLWRRAHACTYSRPNLRNWVHIARCRGLDNGQISNWDRNVFFVNLTVCYGLPADWISNFNLSRLRSSRVLRQTYYGQCWTCDINVIFLGFGRELALMKSERSNGNLALKWKNFEIWPIDFLICKF